jgi:hypothetical protein
VLGRLARLAAVLVVVGALGAGTAAALHGRAAAPLPEPAAMREAARTEQASLPAADPFANPPGYAWAVRPQGVDQPELTNQRDINGTVRVGLDGGLEVSLAHPPRYSRAGSPYYRPVAFDAGGRRFLFTLAEGSMDNTQARNRYRLPTQTLPAVGVKHVGVEVLPPEGRRTAAAHAAELARGRGLNPLPLPELGQPYAFALTAEDGRSITSRACLGRVLVLHCWAYWHQSSLEQREQLRELYRRHKDGLEVVGIDLNNPGDKATGTRWGLSSPGKGWHILDDPRAGPALWANVRVSRDLADRELWTLASEILALPRVLVLDRCGVLRYDTPHDLEEAITALLREP